MVSVPLDVLVLVAGVVGVWLCWWELRKQNKPSDSGESVADKIGTQVNIGADPWSGAHDSHDSTEEEYEDDDRIGFR